MIYLVYTYQLELDQLMKIINILRVGIPAPEKYINYKLDLIVFFENKNRAI